ncbi:hypothetical protein ACT691_12310 [Vibrio metschnikovii]
MGLCRAEGGIEQFKKFVETAPAIANSDPKKSAVVNAEGELSAEEMALCRDHWCYTRGLESQP